MTIILEPYQARGLDEARSLYRSGRRAVLLVGPTGMGKTILASEIARGRVARGGRVVVFAHRRELIRQMAKTLRAAGLTVGAEGEGASAPVQVISVQTALARREIPEADFAIFDEAHHYVSNEWILIPRTYLERGALLAGLSATPERDDGRGLGGEGGIFDGLVVVSQVRELVEVNSLNELRGLVPIDVIEPVEAVRRLAQAPVAAYLEHTPGRHAVVFAPNVKSAHSFADGFNSEGVSAAVVHGELDADDRDSALARFDRGEIRVLVNVAVLTEGWDSPICEVCILGRKIGSPALFFQCVGRARRARKGKRRSTLLDLSGNVALHCHPDAELEFSLDGFGCVVKGRAHGDRPRMCRLCKRELPREGPLGECVHDGRCIDDEHCPECGTKISRIVVPTPEEIELARITRDEARARAPEDKRAKALATLYAKGMRADAKNPKGQAHMIYQRMFRHFPPADVRVAAWRSAIDVVAHEKGDAWTPPEDVKSKRAS